MTAQPSAVSAAQLPDAERRPRRRPRSGPVALAQAGAAVLLTGGALYVVAVSRHAPDKVEHAVVLAVICAAFVGAGLVALRQPPYVRFGLVLPLVGLASLFGALHDANHTSTYTIGFLTGNLVFAALVWALLVFPFGRLRSRGDRLLVVAACLDVLALQAVAALFDPLTRWGDDHPPNAALVDARPVLATALEELEAAVAVALALAVAFVLLRRARSKSAVARRQLLPVLLGGSVALLLFAVGLVLAPLSLDAAIVGIGIGLIASLALPFAFLGLVLHGRLSRAAVGELLVELREAPEAAGLENALRRALGDPSLELARLEEDGRYADGGGRALALPRPGDARAATSILYQGQTVGALVHDRALRLRRGLLDAVSAAAGVALANERALERVQRMEARNRALLDAIPDLIFRLDRDGTHLDVRAEDATLLVAPPDDLIGRTAHELFPAAVTDAVLPAFERAAGTEGVTVVEFEATVHGVPRSFEARIVPSVDGELVAIVRDFTDRRRAEAEQRRLAEEQAALRRVATLVASDPPPEQVFQTVTEEVGRVLGIQTAVLERFEDDETGVIVGRFGKVDGAGFRVGDVLPIEEGLAAWKVRETGAPARVDAYDGHASDLAARVVGRGFRSSVAVPISVAGSVWGALIAPLHADESLPPETERRLLEFAELVALAVSSAQAREELAASRLRIIEASDAERRRLERNLHDGAQQRLVALSVGLRLAQGKVRASRDEAEALLAGAADELTEALTELRELAQGIHPAVLTERGLAAALEVLAARAPLPVALEARLPERLPAPVEAAAYYVVSEALANVVKHAGAASARIRAARLDGHAVVEVEDDGGGGADPDRGSGLRGLRDRVETLDGRLALESAPGRGTRVRAEIPLHGRDGVLPAPDG